MLHDLAAAFRLLTRIPMPANKHANSPASQAGVWFPLVGVTIGTVLLGTASLVNNPAIAALMVTLIWIAITGGLHLDGAADLADGLGAAHGDNRRLLTVMKDPHIGTFGTLTLIAIIMTKWITMKTLFDTPPIWALLLIPTWARLGALYWMLSLKSLGSGLGAQYQKQSTGIDIIVWGTLLVSTSIMLVSVAFTAAACAIILGWRGFLHYRVGGMNGDCLGAGIEHCEGAMLLALVLLQS